MQQRACSSEAGCALAPGLFCITCLKQLSMYKIFIRSPSCPTCVLSLRKHCSQILEECPGLLGLCGPGSGKVSAFMKQNPRKVAAFVSECLDYRRFEASDLLPYATRETLEELGLVGYQIDTLSSDYDDYIDESGMVYDAHGA